MATPPSITEILQGLAADEPITTATGPAVTSTLQVLAAREEQPIMSGASGLERFFDVLNTPQQLLFGVLDKRPSEGLLEAAVRGSRENIRFSDILERQAGFTRGDMGTFALGISGDILFDPALLLAGPIFKGIGLGAKVIGRAGVGIGKRLLGPTISEKLFESAIKPLARKFSKTAFAADEELEFLTKIVDPSITEFQALKRGILLEESDARRLVEEIAQKAGLSVDDVLPIVTERIEQLTKSQLAFPFKTAKESEKIVGHPQVPLFVSNSIDDEFKAIASAQDLAKTEDVVRAFPIDDQRTLSRIVTQEKAKMENLLAKERRFGVKTERLEDSTIDYFTHLTTPEAREALTKLNRFRTFGLKFNPRHASQLTRALTENNPAVAKLLESGQVADIAGLNRLWKEGELFPKLGPQGSNLFVDDPFAIAAVRRIRGEKAIADANIFIKSAMNPKIAALFGREPVDAGYRALTLPTDPRLGPLNTFLKNVRFDPEVATHLEAMVEKTFLPDGLDSFLKVFDSVQGMWKAATLAPFPSYHLRNVVGNLWNNALAGMGVADFKFYKQSSNFQMAVARGRKAELAGEISEELPSMTLGGKVFSGPQIRELSDTLGVSGRGFFSGEVARKSIRALQPAGITLEEVPVIGKVIGKGFDIGSAFEDNARLAHFIWRLDKGDAPIDAALSVKKYLFDYVNGLTAFEQSVLRRAMPFYSWSRFNIPLQAKAVISNPRPFVRLSSLVNTARTKGIGGMANFEERTARIRSDEREILPQFIKEAIGIPIRLDGDGNPEYALLGGWIPAADLEVFGRSDGLVDRIKNLLSPFIKEPIEQAFNFNSFLDRKIEEFPGETTTFLGIRGVRRRYAKTMRNIRLLSEADRIIRTFQDDPTGFTPDQTSAIGQIMRNLFGLKTFRVDLVRQERSLQRSTNILKGKLRAAIRRGDESNASRIRQLIAEGRRIGR